MDRNFKLANNLYTLPVFGAIVGPKVPILFYRLFSLKLHFSKACFVLQLFYNLQVFLGN